jgi:hypothetical protein
MNLKIALTIIITSIIFLNAKIVSAEGLADRANDEVTSSSFPELLIQHINNTYGTTAAGSNMVDMKMKKELNHLRFSYTGQKQNPEFNDMNALEYRKAAFGSNH